MKIEKSVYDGVISYLQSDTSIELCGYLFEKDGVVVKHVVLRNMDNSIDHFTMDPKEQFGAIKLCRKQGLKLTGSYHSHPNSQARPSNEDIKLAYDPSVSYVIVSLVADEPDMKSFKIKSGEVTPEDIEIVELSDQLAGDNMSIDVDKVNAELKGKSPSEVIKWALGIDNPNPILTTNFRPHEAVIVHAVTQQMPEIPVVWIDSGYNTQATYKFANKVIHDFQLNLKLYAPRVSAAHRQAVHGGIPSLDDQAAHDAFTDEVKLEPFGRAIEEAKPTIWFTALRREQTPHRETLDFVVAERNGMLKVSPFFFFTEAEMDAYLAEHNLPNETDYFDPTKVLGKRECGLHTAK